MIFAVLSIDGNTVISLLDFSSSTKASEYADFTKQKLVYVDNHNVQVGWIYDGELFKEVLPAKKTLDEYKQEKIDSAHLAQTKFKTDYESQYPAIEVESFSDKRREALAWEQDNTVSTPTINKLSTAETRVEMLNAVLAKVNALTEVERQTTEYRDAIKLCMTVDECDSVPLPTFMENENE